MTESKARLFIPLTMNPLHRHLDTDRNQINTSIKASCKLDSSVVKGSHGMPHFSPNSISSSSLWLPHAPSSSRKLHISQSKPTSDSTIIEIIKPEKQKYNSNDFIPAFTKPHIIHDTSLEFATMMNLGPLQASFLQGEGEIVSFPQVFSSHTNDPGSSQSSAIISFPTVHSKEPNQLNLICQQPIVQGNKAFHNPSSSSETQSLQYASRDESKPIPKMLGPPLLPPPITKPRLSKCRDYIQGYQHYPLSKVKVVCWVNGLQRYLFLWKTGRMNSAHAAELHHLLCTIEDKMAHPFLTPQVLGETSLGQVTKSFRHGGHDARSKEVACRIIRYWRKVCLEA